MDRHATAVWSGTLKEGKGTVDTQSGALKGVGYSFKGRFEDESGKSGTNPEELIAAAHAGCFAMQFSHFLAENGTPAEKLDARAVITLVPVEIGSACWRSLPVIPAFKKPLINSPNKRRLCSSLLKASTAVARVRNYNL